MRRLFSTAFYFFRYAVLSATLVVIGGFLMATLADGAMGGGPHQATAFAAIVLAGLVLPALMLRRPAPRARRARARQASRRRPAFLPRNGHAFEEWVAGRLEAQGWRAHVTAGSGDQGIDIIARRKGRKIGIQCKRYDGAVGNKAVQEAFSGRAYHRVDTAVVITTGHYTESAKALSRRTGVHLLHVRDIGRLDRLI